MAEDPAPGSGRDQDPAGWYGARGFASGGPLDTALPSAALTRDLDQASGPARRCAGVTDDEAFGMLGRWEAAEAWCASAKLGVIRALIRRRARPGYEPARPAGLPGAWQEGLTQEVSNQLAVSPRAADALIGLAADLDTRLTLTREALEAGVISLAKARIIAEATAVLDDQHAAVAETLIADQLAGKTPGQIAALIARAVVKVDPDGARKRRERAQKEDARVRFWREHAGTAALAAFGLPPDEALAANQHIQDRALAYRAAGITGTLDQLRVRAFLDAINGTPAPAGPDPAHGPGNGAAVASNTMLTIPLPTLLGLAEHPGEAHGLGALDPALARQLAAAAARNPRSTWCLTVTDTRGHAIGHGCAKVIRTRRKPGRTAPHAARDGPRFTVTPTGDPGPDGGYGSWHLKIAGQQYTVTLHPIPVTSCDHRYQTAAYRPGALLRHLIEVRDGQCTQPTCVRAARRCDFEHAIPHHKGGRTCGCNGGCRCRRDHRIKQSPGWTVTQPRPGYHQWTTPAGRTYTTEPMRYPI